MTLRPTRCGRTLAITVVALSALSVAPLASAATPWTRASTGAAPAKARALSAGSTPVASSVNVPAGNVTLTWGASSLTNGGPAATGYTVARYDARTGTVAKPAACTASGATTCAEGSVPAAGTWQYAVTPTYAAWLGAVSARTGDVNIGPPSPVAGSVTTTNGGGAAGKPDQADTITVQFSQRMDVSTLCGTWSGNGTDQSVTADGVVTINLVNNGAGAGQDALTISTTGAACSGAPNFGSFNLGANYVAQSRTCSGTGTAASTASWTASTSTLTIRLGACGGTKSVGSSTITYTPAAALRNSTGTAVTGTATSANAQQF